MKNGEVGVQAVNVEADCGDGPVATVELRLICDHQTAERLLHLALKNNIKVDQKEETQS